MVTNPDGYSCAGRSRDRRHAECVQTSPGGRDSHPDCLWEPSRGRAGADVAVAGPGSSNIRSKSCSGREFRTRDRDPSTSEARAPAPRRSDQVVASCGSAGALFARRPGLVRVGIRGADARPDRRLGIDLDRTTHADPCPDREWQDPCGVPVVPRSAGPRSVAAAVKTTPGSVRVLYVSPLKALTYDVERNLRAPLHGIGLAAQRLGEPEPRISIAGRTGDTPQEQRRELAKRPPDILVTTPESLYLLLTSAAARDAPRRRDGDRRRGPRDRRLEARGPSRAVAGAPGAPPAEGRAHASSGSACRRRSGHSRRSPASSAGSGPGARSRSSMPAAARRSSSRSSSRSRTWPASARSSRRTSSPSGPVAFGDMRSSIWPAIHPRLLELISAHR